MSQSIPASQQVNQLTQALLSAFNTREDALAKVKEADANILAIRNVLGGVPVGQQLQQEIDASKVNPPVNAEAMPTAAHVFPGTPA
jgi:hypothetical protein